MRKAAWESNCFTLTLLRLHKTKHSKAVFLLCSILLTISFKFIYTVYNAQIRPTLALTSGFVLKEVYCTDSVILAITRVQ